MGALTVRGVITNGGMQPQARATLARCILDALGLPAVPVGIGSEGKEYSCQPHEYRIAGYEQVDIKRLLDGSALLLSVLRESAPKSLTVVCISSLRDLADAMSAQPALVEAKVAEVAIQAGLERGEDSSWVPDSSVNNGFDMEGAALVYRYCFERGLPMSVVSRFAVPMLPMQLAKSFSETTDCPVMSYLAGAQSLGLEGLWQKLCSGKLPSRCSKQVRWRAAFDRCLRTSCFASAAFALSICSRVHTCIRLRHVSASFIHLLCVAFFFSALAPHAVVLRDFLRSWKGRLHQAWL